MPLTFKSTGQEQVFAVMKDPYGRIAITTGTQDGNGYEFVTVLPRGEVCRERVPNIEWIEANEHAQQTLARHRAQFILDRSRNDQDPVRVSAAPNSVSVSGGEQDTSPPTHEDAINQFGYQSRLNYRRQR